MYNFWTLSLHLDRLQNRAAGTKRDDKVISSAGIVSISFLCFLVSIPFFARAWESSPLLHFHQQCVVGHHCNGRSVDSLFLQILRRIVAAVNRIDMPLSAGWYCMVLSYVIAWIDMVLHGIVVFTDSPMDCSQCKWDWYATVGSGWIERQRNWFLNLKIQIAIQDWHIGY